MGYDERTPEINHLIFHPSLHSRSGNIVEPTGKGEKKSILGDSRQARVYPAFCRRSSGHVVG
jgi:hypothetical protein